MEIKGKAIGRGKQRCSEKAEGSRRERSEGLPGGGGVGVGAELTWLVLVMLSTQLSSGQPGHFYLVLKLSEM